MELLVGVRDCNNSDGGTGGGGRGGLLLTTVAAAAVAATATTTTTRLLPPKKKPKSDSWDNEEEGGVDLDGGGSKIVYRCDTCSYVTDVKARYTKHVKYHTMPLIKCDYCDFKTPYKWNLDRHYKNHNGEGDLRCHLCNFTADIKQSLTVHLQNHHSSYPGHSGEDWDIGSKGSGTRIMMMNSDRNVCGGGGAFDLSGGGGGGNSGSGRDKEITELKLNGNGLDLSSKSGGGVVFDRNGNNNNNNGRKINGDNNGRKRGLEEDEEDDQQQAIFLQSLSLLPKGSLSGGGGIVRKKKEPKLRLDELTKKLAAKSEVNGATFLKSCMANSSNSTRCQYCRQRCKTSGDLALHMAVCAEAGRIEDENRNDDDGEEEMTEEDDARRGNDNNQIFVWNQFAGENGEEDIVDDDDDDDDDDKLVMDVSGGNDDLVGFETAPGIGAIHVGKLDEVEYEGYHGNYMDEDDGTGDYESSVTKTRKVFRCPQTNCGFWATTASRFHVHIVGHHNLKPFECSECSYKSNWRWDITKHIKLKAVRDPGHENAKVLLTHESGNRNYRQYDRHLVTMQLKYAADSKIPDCSTVAKKRTDFALEVSPVREVVASPKISPRGILLPKLTRAPYPSRTSSPSESVKSDESGSKRPPPALVPINGHGGLKKSPSPSTLIVQKRMLSGGHVASLEDTEIDLSKYGTTFTPVTIVSKPAEMEMGLRNSDVDGEKDGKKHSWKCKKCPFKHVNKDVVVLHIRQHHKPKRGESVSILSGNHLTSVAQDDDDDMIGMHQAQYQNGQPSCNFSCNRCSVTVQTKRELMEHAQRHIWENRLNQSDDKPTGDLTISAEETPPKPRTNAGGSHKKYHCMECPYVTDSKGQFLYHKQFHRPRDCPFKCNHCSYTVSHKHLLHQHLRVHGVATPASVSPPSLLGDMDGQDDDDQPLNLHASVKLTETVKQESEQHPSVLVWRNGRPLRMYRCSQCPHVFGKLPDLLDHENSHTMLGVDIVQPLVVTQQQRSMLVSPCSSTDSGTTGARSEKVLYCCDACPARFFYEKELEIHSTFHQTKSEYQCDLCTYSAKQQSPHLMSHMKVHGFEYQQKTAQLLQRYPKASKTRNKSGPVTLQQKPAQPIESQPKISLAAATNLSMKNQFENSVLCPKCPAKLQTLQAYQQHLSYHGRNSIFKCRSCDYSVDSIKNLTLHELLHTNESNGTDQPETIVVQPRITTASGIVPMAMDTDDDPIDDDAFVGNPGFTYPTYIKNGRVKSKRYKCSKCPSAFEKRDQYKVHMGLHGSDQRYKCPVCDYAVTYYANFIQHLKKHSTQPEVPPELLVAKPLSKIKQEEIALLKPSGKTASGVLDKPQKENTTRKGQFKWKCDLCPFSTDETKARDEHRKRHIRKTVKGDAHTCSFCDYTVPTKALLVEHVKLHFKVPMESIQSYLFASDVDIYVNGNFEEKIYSEKENYEDHEDDHSEDEDDSYTSSNQDEAEKSPAQTRPIQYIDMASRLPVAMAEDASDDEEGANTLNISRPEVMDCTA